MAEDIRPDVCIRPYGAEDLPVLERLLGDPTMTLHLGGPESPEALQSRHERYLASDPETGGLFTIEVGAEKIAAGWVGYWESEQRGEMAWECGWHVLPEFQGAGVASSATRLALAHAGARRLHRFVYAFPAVQNEASNALCRRLGFELLGEAEVEYPKGHLMHSNEWRFELPLGG